MHFRVGFEVRLKEKYFFPMLGKTLPDLGFLVFIVFFLLVLFKKFLLIKEL